MPRLFTSCRTGSLRKCLTLLRKAEVPDSRVSLKEIIKKVTGTSQNGGFGNPKYSSVLMKEIQALVKMRAQRVPLQYVIGEWDFRGLTLEMRPPVFVPRPETEQLVDLALQHVRDRPEVTRVLEVGCGSGAISLALCQETPQVLCTAVDGSESACDLTLRNADLCEFSGDNLQIFKCMLTLEGHLDCPILSSAQFDLVISNPPYVTSQEMIRLQPEISRYEDPLALCGGEDGLDVVRSLLRLCSGQTLAPGGTLLMEVGLQHPQMVAQLVAQEHPGTLVFQSAHKDFTGRERFVQVCKPKDTLN